MALVNEPFVARNIPVFGLIGGVGSGKSRLASALRETRRVAIIDGDVAGHEVLRQSDVKEEIRRRFGPDVFNEYNEVDRRKVGRLVFGTSPEHRAARTALETIVHPRITEKLKSQIAAARADSSLEAILLDAAVLLESGWRRLCDRLIYIDVPYDQRLARVSANRGWDAQQLHAREESQLPLEQKRKEADDVVDNSRGIEHAVSQLEAIISRLSNRGYS